MCAQRNPAVFDYLRFDFSSDELLKLQDFVLELLFEILERNSVELA
jgi:hypothetical protein